MTHLAIVSWDQDNRVTKYQPFGTLAEAAAHSVAFGGFATTDPGGKPTTWLVDPVAETLSISVPESHVLAAKAKKRAAVDALRDVKMETGLTITSLSGTWKSTILEMGLHAAKAERYGRLNAGVARTITGITQANPGVISYTGDAIPNRELVRITSVVGMSEINNQIYRVVNGGAGTMQLKVPSLGGALLDTTGFTAYASGGSARIFVSTVEADNTKQRLTFGNFTTMRDEVGSYHDELNQTGRDHKDAINALSTVAEVNAYDITTDWPSATV